MVRTKQSMSYKVSAGRIPKIAACKAAVAGGCSVSSSSGHKSSSSPSTSKNKYSGGNPVHPREIPVWQKEITCFFQVKNDEQSRLLSANEEDDDVVELCSQETAQKG
ncbi:PCNA-associated factor-like [Melanaphis sacchari]|uniref:PCNA-associated factor n=1 Tax=Melanaphis sacchari TaxID=742174 RepID=A0A2H8TU64_9HEMI|nr:PCNA-associated factor-like [Melanaphis sacchari]